MFLKNLVQISLERDKLSYSMISGTETSLWLKSQPSSSSVIDQDSNASPAPFQINNTMVLGGAALVGFTSLLWTIRKRTLGM